jgi:hypothetical protein
LKVKKYDEIEKWISKKTYKLIIKK